MNTSKRLRQALSWLIVLALTAVLLIVFRSSPWSTQESSEAQSASPLAAAPERPGGASGAQPPVSLNRAWELVDPDSVERLPRYKEEVPGRRLVRVTDAMRNWKQGDKVIFELGQAKLEGVVELVDVDGWGNRSYVGRIAGSGGRAFRFVVTMGARNVFAYLDSPQGSFELVAPDGLGWLMSTANMDQHMDYSRSDVIGPADERRKRRY